LLAQYETERQPRKLLEIQIPGIAEIIRLQRHQANDYFFDGKAYEYFPFSIDSALQKSMELDNESVEITIINAGPVKEFLRQYNGLRKSVVTIYTLFADRPDAPPTAERLQVASTNPKGGVVTFSLKSPINAIGGSIPAKYFTQQDFPELPIVSQVQF